MLAPLGPALVGLKEQREATRAVRAAAGARRRGSEHRLPARSGRRQPGTQAERSRGAAGDEERSGPGASGPPAARPAREKRGAR